MKPHRVLKTTDGYQMQSYQHPWCSRLFGLGVIWRSYRLISGAGDPGGIRDETILLFPTPQDAVRECRQLQCSDLRRMYGKSIPIVEGGVEIGTVVIW